MSEEQDHPQKNDVRQQRLKLLKTPSYQPSLEIVRALAERINSDPEIVRLRTMLADEELMGKTTDTQREAIQQQISDRMSGIRHS